jgi:hypothetical protein
MYNWKTPEASIVGIPNLWGVAVGQADIISPHAYSGSLIVE